MSEFQLGEGGLEVFDDVGGDDVGIEKIATVFEAFARTALSCFTPSLSNSTSES
jgi:hypothetical protein